METIVCPVGDVYEAVVGDTHGMHNPKLGRWWAVRIVLTGRVLVLDSATEGGWEIFSQLLEVPIVRLASVSPPVPFVGSCLSVEYDYAMVDVSIGYVEFILSLIHISEPTRPY